MLLKGAAQNCYEFGATIRLLQIVNSGPSAFGLLLWNKQESIEISLTQTWTEWKLLIEDTKAVPPLKSELVLPPDFDPQQWHTLRLLVNDRQLDLYLDGPQVLTLGLAGGGHRCGLLTRDAACAFVGVWQTGFVL